MARGTVKKIQYWAFVVFSCEKRQSNAAISLPKNK
jgi:hypothetical protein